MFQLGIDLGGTKIEGIILSEDGKSLFRERIATEQQNGYHHIIGRIQQLYNTMCAHVNGGEHTLGIGTPGAISPRSGLMKNSNTQCLNGKPFADDLRKELGRDFTIQNDANCFALAESQYGAGAGFRLVFGVIMGTGCGGGIVYKGEVISGPQSITGEWGHSSIDRNGIECWCGSRGCVERYISGSGMEELWFSKYSEKIPVKKIIDHFRTGDKTTIEFMRYFFDSFGRALANIINILDPDCIVLGGGLSNIDELYIEGIECVKRYVFSDGFCTPIIRNKVGDSAGVIGAALIGI